MPNGKLSRPAITTFKMRFYDTLARIFDRPADYFSTKWYDEFIKFNGVEDEEL